jgi:hypothetical protein
MQENRIEPRRYYELFEKDTIKFGNSRYDHTTNTGFFCVEMCDCQIEMCNVHSSLASVNWTVIC